MPKSPASGSAAFRRLHRGDPKNDVEIIVRRGPVLPLKAASHAAMIDHPLPALQLRADRFHEAAAGRSAVARIHVNVPAPETCGAMVRIAVADDRAPAISADKIFFCAFKTPCHADILSEPGLDVTGAAPYTVDMPNVREKYIAELKRRAKESHVYRSYQLIGLEIADILHDRPHKALYIKLAKEKDPRRLLAAAKDVAERKEVKNKGAYFMKVIMEEPSSNHHAQRNLGSER